MIAARSPRYTALGFVELVAKFPWLNEEVSFCASPNDSEAHGRDLFARAIAGEFGPIAAYVAPPALIPQRLTPWQIRKALNQLGLREVVESAVAASSDQDLKDGWAVATEFNRLSPLVINMGAALGKTDAELDALFTLGASL